MRCEEKLSATIEFGRAIYGKKSLVEAFEIIASFVENLLNCDRCSLYLYDEQKEELWTIVAHGLKDKITLELGSGIVGHCALTQEVITVDDAYADPYFISEYDQKFGYKTQTVLAIPIIDKNGSIIGVIQALNKRGENPKFTGDDSDMVLVASEYFALLIENAKFHERMDALLSEKTQELEVLNRHLESRVESALDEISHKDKLLVMHGRQAAMGEMIGVIAHQWKQPMSAINIVASLIQSEIEMGEGMNTDKALRYLDELMNLNEFMSRTVDDFRNFFNPNKIRKSAMLSDVADEVLNLLQKQLMQEKIVVDMDFRIENPILIYKNEIIHVILNILKNALDVLSEQAGKEGRILIEGREEEGCQVLEISDNGGGISEENMDKVFAHYFSTKDEKSGTGLGLYISKIIIEEHSKGRISVSNTDEGAKFTVWLPV